MGGPQKVRSSDEPHAAPLMHLRHLQALPVQSPAKASADVLEQSPVSPPTVAGLSSCPFAAASQRAGSKRDVCAVTCEA